MHSNQLLKRQQVKDWLESPVSIHFLDLIQEHLEANKESLSNRLLYSPSFKDIQEDLLQVKGQILTLELINDIETFLEERVENDEEQSVQTDSTDSSGEDQ